MAQTVRSAGSPYQIGQKNTEIRPRPRPVRVQSAFIACFEFDHAARVRSAPAAVSP
eukprot:gene8500-biopygen18128